MKLSERQSCRQILNLRCAARVLGVRPENLKREAEAGRVPCARLGDEFVFSLSHLERTLEQEAS
jgi:hypothetical protein